MGLIFFLGINWLLIALAVGLIKKPGELRSVAKSWIDRPFMNAFMLVWVSSILVAGWGVLTGGYFSWLVATPWGRLQSWQLGGIIAFVGLLVFFRNLRLRESSELKAVRTMTPNPSFRRTAFGRRCTHSLGRIVGGA